MPNALINSRRTTIAGRPAKIFVYQTKSGRKLTKVMDVKAKKTFTLTSTAPDRWSKFKWPWAAGRSSARRTSKSRRRH